MDNNNNDYEFVREDGEEIATSVKKPEEGKAVDRPKSTNVSINLNCDTGMLLVEDCQSYDKITATEFSKRTASNLCTLYKQLFDLKKAQDAKHGPDGEILEYTKSRYLVDMPEPVEVLPREKPCPVEKAKTKWEKFRLERGMAPRQRRSRLIFDPISNDWVPRWGKDSVKKIEDKHNWLMPSKEKYIAAGMDPWQYARAEKKKVMEKQKLNEVRNQVNAVKPGAMKDIKVLGKAKTDAPSAPVEGGKGLKRKSDGERTSIRKREHKALMKSLTLAQMSTGSMGKFDRKAGKNEPAAPTSQKIVKKKSSKGLADLSHNRKGEQERNMKIFNLLQKKQDLAVAGVGKARVNAHINDDKLAKKSQRKEEGARKKMKKM